MPALAMNMQSGLAAATFWSLLKLTAYFVLFLSGNMVYLHHKSILFFCNWEFESLENILISSGFLLAGFGSMGNRDTYV